MGGSFFGILPITHLHHSGNVLLTVVVLRKFKGHLATKLENFKVLSTLTC